MPRYKTVGQGKDPGIDIAFEAMKKATTSKASNLFTESEYNAFATDKEREGYDRKAFNILKGMYDADSAKNKFKDIDFNRYLELLKPSLFEERVLSREGDQKAGDFFLDVYEGDFDQFRASASAGKIEQYLKAVPSKVRGAGRSPVTRGKY